MNPGANGKIQAVKQLPPEFYTQYLSENAKERKPSPIRSLMPLEATPGLVSFLAGKPNASTFPFTSLSFSAKPPPGPTKGEEGAPVNITLSDAELAEGLQYGPTDGQKKLCDWIYELQAWSHGRKRGEGWKVSIGSGSQDLIFKAVTATVNPGDPVLVETPVYAGVLPMFQSLHCELLEVLTDASGIKSSSLRSIMETWPAGKAKPKVLYTVPYGCNPTGMTATLERRKEVLQIAKEYNILILEDDPYFYLYYGKAPRYPSYFALEREESEVGRVVRFDSFSKILSAGIRIGFASGPEPILRAMDAHTMTSNLQVSGLTQIIAFKLLDAWGCAGFVAHTERVSAFYKQKCDVFENALRKYLDGLVQWTTPEAGMFFWFKLIINPGDEGDTDEGDSLAIIRKKAFENGVLALPGSVFLPSGRNTGYVRAAFSLSTEEEVEEGMKRLRKVLLEAREEASALRNGTPK
ncbi:hypothetical protein AX16_007361 [Volvariella volvacea WC 439]|nr:hypothetical protein AX16_007361 [Volvariella volvacea WC 439]